MTPVTQAERLMTLPSDQDASGRTFGEEEIGYVTEVLRSGTLTTTKGKFGKLLEQKFAEKFGAKYAYACTSGSARGSRAGPGSRGSGLGRASVTL